MINSVSSVLVYAEEFKIVFSSEFNFQEELKYTNIF